MKIQRLHTLLPLLAIATLLTIGSGPSYGQRFSFGGKSSGKSRSGSGISRIGGSSNLGKSFGQKSLGSKSSGSKSFGQRTLGHSSSKSKLGGISSRTSTNRTTTTIKNLIGNRTNPSKATPAVIGNRGKIDPRLGDLKSKLGGLTDGKTKDLRDRDHRIGNWTEIVKGKGKGTHIGSAKHGKLGHLLNLIHDNRRHNKICITGNSWCHTRPKACHWWYDWCRDLRYCEPVHYVHCGWQYVTCDYVVDGRVVVEDARWYLGLKGLFLPGRGIGIEEVAAGSPAAAVGLQPGMVITHCNGVELIDETALAQVIEQSRGVLRMDLLINGDQTPATCVVVMQRVSSISY